jgi:plasmid stabilization system protein ParE
LAKVIYAARALTALERIIDFVLERDPEWIEPTVSRIREAISVLERHPLMGRPVDAGLRELVISQGRTGYVALYRFLEEDDVALVLTLRHQREVGPIDRPPRGPTAGRTGTGRRR